MHERCAGRISSRELRVERAVSNRRMRDDAFDLPSRGLLSS
jgi:hypothetical protein